MSRPTISPIKGNMFYLLGIRDENLGIRDENAAGSSQVEDAFAPVVKCPLVHGKSEPEHVIELVHAVFSCNSQLISCSRQDQG